MESHTLTPWYSHEGARDSEFDYICGPKGTFICELDVSHPEQKANVEFIVRACNVHDELVAIANRFLKHCCTDCNPDLEALLKRVLAKAEGTARVS